MTNTVSVLVSADAIDSNGKQTVFGKGSGLSTTRAFQAAIDAIQARNPFATIVNPFIERTIYFS